eukprot:TRINITY_DN7651_c0_g1_i6.p1 TRINITY_DN7651_c0_g1~~TRINITY_DN7651_c0_g1_i6.p1  ORF type:complete len:257 (+),score=12.99 TRINITY_DN7651_c0_g1_i6:202-972(+)
MALHCFVPNLVISAAHCFDWMLDSSNKTPTLDIFASLAPRCRHLASTREFKGQRFQVKKVEIVPAWDRERATGDLAILILDQSLPGPYVQLNTDFFDALNFTYPEMFVAGWGAINPNEIPNRTEILLGIEPYYLRQLYQDQVDYVDEPQCKQVLREYDESVGNLSYVTVSNTFDFETMICAIPSDRTGATCLGDSGSPLVLKGSTPVDDVLVGIVSWGPPHQCITLERTWKQAPGIFTRVSTFANWIDEIIFQYSS